MWRWLSAHCAAPSIWVTQCVQGGHYHLFIARTAYVDPLMFQLATQQNLHSAAVRDAEKTKFAWRVPRSSCEPTLPARADLVLLDRVRLQDLLRTCGNMEKQYYLHLPHRTPGMRRGGTRYMQLHPCFARTMRLAQVWPTCCWAWTLLKLSSIGQSRAAMVNLHYRHLLELCSASTLVMLPTALQLLCVRVQAAGLGSLVQDMRKESRALRPWCHQLVAASSRPVVRGGAKSGRSPDAAAAAAAAELVPGLTAAG